MNGCPTVTRSLAMIALASAAPAHGQAISPPSAIAPGGQWAYAAPYEQVVTDTFDVRRIRLIANAALALGGSWQDDMIMELQAPGGAMLLIGGDFGIPYPGSVRWGDPSLSPLGVPPASTAQPIAIDLTVTFAAGAANGTWRVNFRNHWINGGAIRWDDIQIIPCAPGLCPELGVCCLPNGTCIELQEPDCFAAGGAFAGGGIECASYRCPAPPGVHAEFDDAGDLPPIAQRAEGSGALHAIIGRLTSASDVDMFMVEICEPAAFSATTVNTGTEFDTILALFDAQGLGVAYNDDSNFSHQSTLTPAFITEPGVYYLAVSRFSRHPVSSGGRIWLPTPYDTERAPDGPGANDQISHWEDEALAPAGSYIIDLTGACFLSTGSCYPNCDGSTSEPILNIDDITCFINEFAAAQTLPHSQQVIHYANCDGSTTEPALNVDDFTCFINAYATGCR
jgi:hypothetical protein